MIQARARAEQCLFRARPIPSIAPFTALRWIQELDPRGLRERLGLEPHEVLILAPKIAVRRPRDRVAGRSPEIRDLPI
ncbi:hypothetical protein PPSIR1_11958 [Plesiocystis pacifica SIR-1]|uniref:Uncharacterized protein n=1 Tax=Plesiocystis pacifica SIR-1 TaxID=391625 RepID=A6GIH8_9BACT|nr:hypothetical protein [Plesiocystis pacifica]EDM74341.1 hypothetical protein PPSIR1_11958 [Plesiocystis pacifica SIR-1]